MNRITQSRVIKVIYDCAFVVGLIAIVATAAIYVGLQLLGYKFYEVSSPSMEPVFGKGDVVAAKSVAAHDVKIGNVIVFNQEGFTEPIVHRVVKMRSDPDVHATVRDEDGDVIRESTTWAPRTFWTKGDHNPVQDPNTVNGSAVVGKFAFVVPWPFNLIVTKVTKSTLLVLACIAVSSYIALELFDIVKKLMDRRGHQVAAASVEASDR